MKDLKHEYLFFVALVIGVTILTLLSGSPMGFLNYLLLLLVLGVMVMTRTWQDRGFYLTCGGEPLVIACSIMNPWAGLFTVCMLAGIVCDALELLKSRQDIKPFAFFCGSSFLIALLIQVSNHVILPLLILAGIAAIIIAIQSVRMHQFRKHYSGA
ncbi:MAG: hypothetical protein Q7T80_17540 [Methanoregula sp.]|nr:hypothetical protein [Methanoregula sp.]